MQKKLRNLKSLIFSLVITRSLTDGCARCAFGLPAIHEFSAPQLEGDQSPQFEIEITAAIVHHDEALDIFRIQDSSLPTRAIQEKVAHEAVKTASEPPAEWNCKTAFRPVQNLLRQNAFHCTLKDVFRGVAAQLEFGRNCRGKFDQFVIQQ